jgi:hypothetical protein
MARKKTQSVDMTTHPSKVSPTIIKHKDPVTPQNQNRSCISDVGNVGMSRQASSTPSHISKVHSPTLPAMAFPLCVVFCVFIFWFIAYCCLLIGKEINMLKMMMY